MQLLLKDELEQAIRVHPRPYGRIRCDSNHVETLLARKICGSVSSEPAVYPGFAVEGDGHRAVALAFLKSDPPEGSGPWVLAPGTTQEDGEIVERHLAKARGLPYLPADYQPYVAKLLSDERQLLVVGSKETALLRRRRIVYPPGVSWYQVPVVKPPVALTHHGGIPSLSRRAALIVGLGSLGSCCADLMAAAGMGRLVLVDPDALELRNMRRHLCGVDQLGRAKTDAVAQELRRRGYDTELDLMNRRAQVAGADEVRAKASECDVLLCTADSAAARQFVNHCAVSLGIPAVIADIQLRPEPLGEIVVVSPTEGGCFNCWRRELEQSGLMVRSHGHDPLDYPEATPHTPVGLPMYQIALVAAAASGFAGATVPNRDFASRKWLMAMEAEVSGFEDLKVGESKVEALDRDSACGVCAKR